jgi:hypothetical protein
MRSFARALSLALLVIAGLSMCGCIHTWTETYREYPPSAWDPAGVRTQRGNPPSD